jgi:acetylglutamate kinase
MIDGRRITSAEMLKVVTMVYGGLVNKNLVARLQALGVNAIGLSGADMNLIMSVKRPVELVNFGYVGDVRYVNVKALVSLLEAGAVPVFAPLTHDKEGSMLNTNADTMAAAISVALGAKLFYCFEKNGVLCDRNDEDSVIPSLDPAGFERLKAEGRVAEGMIPKLDNAFGALRNGACGVVIRNASRLLEPGGTELKI